MDEAFGMALVCEVEYLLSGGDHLWRESIMYAFGGQQTDATVVVFVVVPAEEVDAKGACVLDAAEPFGELGPVLQSLELAFRKRVIIGDVGTAVGLGDAQVGQHHGHRLGFHG